MWSPENRKRIGAAARLAIVVAAAGLLAGCFEPLYGRNPSVGDESVRDKLAEVVIAPIAMRQGTPQARVAVAMRNALQFDLNGAAGAIAPTHRLDVTVTPTAVSVSIDPVTGRPTEEIGGVNASYQMVEIATGRIVLFVFSCRRPHTRFRDRSSASPSSALCSTRRTAPRRWRPKRSATGSRLISSPALSLTRANGRAVWQNPPRQLR